MPVARVNLIDAPYSLDKTYDYYIPEPLTESIIAGGFVVVPFGGGNRRQIALVTEVSDHTDIRSLKSRHCMVRLKTQSLLHPSSLLSAYILKKQLSAR